MTAADIQRQYDEIIAEHYDLDPLSVIRDSLDTGLNQIEAVTVLTEHDDPLRVLDVGMGTGLFYEQLRSRSRREIAPFGLDLSERMVEVARNKFPDLTAEVGDAAEIVDHFLGETFDLICTHFITGFVPIGLLAPEIFAKLKPGGVWSFVGGTSEGYPELQRVANSRPIKVLFRGAELDLGGLTTPQNQEAVEAEMHRCGFEVCDATTFEPELNFANFDEFMEFGWTGGWLTPFIEDLGLHRAGRPLRAMLNLIAFPLTDRHRIVIGTARKPLE